MPGQGHIGENTAWSVKKGKTFLHVCLLPPGVTTGDIDPIPTASPTCATSTVVAVTSSATVKTLAVADATRKLVIFYNNTDGICFLKYDTGATAALFTIALQPTETHFIDGPIYTGIVTGIWTGTPTGDVMVTRC